MSIDPLEGDPRRNFSTIAFDALKLTTVAPYTYEAHCLWTPAISTATYGGQLLAHATEAAYRTVNEAEKSIHSLHVTFVDKGISEDGTPLRYTVRRLRDGKSITLREVTATQQGQLVMTAVVGFHRREVGGLSHRFLTPHFAREDSDLETSVRRRQQSLPLDAFDRIARPDAATVEFKHLKRFFTDPNTSHDIWCRVDVSTLKGLSAHTGIPFHRISLLLSIWLSDFTVALSVFLPHDKTVFQDLQMIASLNHSIYFHQTEKVSLENWILFDVSSVWAGGNRGLTRGCCYSASGDLCFSVVQENLIRTSKPFQCKL